MKAKLLINGTFFVCLISSQKRLFASLYALRKNSGQKLRSINFGQKCSFCTLLTKTVLTFWSKTLSSETSVQFLRYGILDIL